MCVLCRRVDLHSQLDSELVGLVSFLTPYELVVGRQTGRPHFVGWACTGSCGYL